MNTEFVPTRSYSGTTTVIIENNHPTEYMKLAKKERTLDKMPYIHTVVVLHFYFGSYAGDQYTPRVILLLL